MSSTNYQNICNRLEYFENTFENIETGIIESKNPFKVLPDKEMRELEGFDSMITLIEIDLFKNEFSDSYKQYFSSLNNRYEKLFRQIVQELDLLSKKPKYDRTKKDRPMGFCFNSGAYGALIFLHDFVIAAIRYFEKGISENVKTIELEDNVPPVKMGSLNPIEEIIKHTEELSMTEDENKTEIQEIPEQIISPKGKSHLTREQVALLFFYLREKQIIAKPTNGNMAKAIQLLTGNSAKQIQDIMKSSGTPVYLLGKDNNKVTRNDFKTVIAGLKELIEKIEKDYKENSENNELK